MIENKLKEAKKTFLRMGAATASGLVTFLAIGWLHDAGVAGLEEWVNLLYDVQIHITIAAALLGYSSVGVRQIKRWRES